MLSYQFNEIYFRVTGEYENDIQLLFFNSDTSDIMLFDGGCFYLVNKPAKIYLEDFKLYANEHKKIYQMLRIVEDNTGDIYIGLEGSLIKIGWHFSTTDGQQVKDFWLYTLEEHPTHYNQSLNNMESAKEVIPTDLSYYWHDLMDIQQLRNIINVYKK